MASPWSKVIFVRLESSDYAPLGFGDPKPYRMYLPALGELDPLNGGLDDSLVLMGAFLIDKATGMFRPATVGDLQTGRGPEMYWKIKNDFWGVSVYWRTNNDVYRHWEMNDTILVPFHSWFSDWSEGTWVFEHLVIAKKRSQSRDTMTVLDSPVLVSKTGRPLRRALNGRP